MEWVETTGRTVDEAKEAALDQLGVDETDAEFVVVGEPRPGLFGRMRGEARVRARVVPTVPRPKRGRGRGAGQERRRPSGRSARSAAGASGTAVAEVDVDGDTDIDDPDVSEGSANGSRPRSSSSTGAPTGTSSGQRRRRSRGSRGRGGGGAGRAGGPAQDGPGQGSGAEPGARGNGSQAEPSEGSMAGPSRQAGRSARAGGRSRGAEGAKEEPVGEVLSLEEQGESAREFIVGLVRELWLQAEVSVKLLDEDTAEVSVDGAELGILVGPGGATLGALQELARTYVQKRTGGHSDRILVDVAGYRARRAEALQRFTRQVAEEVMASGTPRSLEPMSASDRKVVHDTVNEMGGVVTRSEGEDPRRYIVISRAMTDGPAPAVSQDGAQDEPDEEPADG